MKIRSSSELNQFLSEDLAWRKREITTVRLMLLSRKRSHEQRAMLRANTCILYAHWEGFVKRAATAYLNFVALQGLRFCDVTPSLVALALRGKLKAAEQANRITVHTEVTSFLLSDMHETIDLPWKDAVTTTGNLNSEVLQDILGLLSLSYTPYETKKVVLDEKLLGRRNSIAHGDYLELQVSDYEEIHSEVLLLIELFRDHVENAAATRAFART